MKLKRYKPDFDHSYALGVYPCLELMQQRPADVLEAVVCPTAERNAGAVRLQELCGEHGVHVRVSDRTLRTLSRRTNCHAACAFRKYECALAPERDHVALVQPDNMGNVGTIMRTMLAFGVRDLALVRPAVDAFDPRVVRASMGAVFRMAFAYWDSFDAYLTALPREVYPLLTDGAVELGSAEFRRPWALVFGNEGAGLGSEFRALGTSIRIPQSGAVDSLNLAIAAGVALYEATRGGLSP